MADVDNLVARRRMRGSSARAAVTALGALIWLCACGYSYDAAQDRGPSGDTGAQNGPLPSAGSNPNANANAGSGNLTPSPGAGGLATGPNAVFTAAAVQATAADANVEALIAAGFSDDTTSSLTPMGRRFLSVLGTPVPAQQLALLQNASFQPPLPLADRGTVAYVRWPIAFYAVSSPNVAEFVGGGSDLTSAATLFGLAWQNPSFARGMVAQQDANTFAVRLYDPNGGAVSVVVDNLLPTSTTNPNLLAYVMAGSTDTVARLPRANWASLVDKAIMKYCYVYGLGDTTQAAFGAAGFLGSEMVSAILTGNGSSIAFDAGRLSPAAMQVVVARAMASGAAVIGGFGQNSNDIGGWQVTPGMAYTIGGASGAGTGVALQYRDPNSFLGNVDGTALVDGPGHRGVLSLAPDDPLLALLELRIMAPGAAAGGSNTAAFDPAAPGGHATHR